MKFKTSKSYKYIADSVVLHCIWISTALTCVVPSLKVFCLFFQRMHLASLDVAKMIVILLTSQNFAITHDRHRKANLLVSKGMLATIYRWLHPAQVTKFKMSARRSHKEKTAKNNNAFKLI